MSVLVKVANAARLQEGETLVFEHHTVTGFVLRWQGEWRAFRNRCPHWSVDLDLGDQRFYAGGIDRIYCKNHGALFHPGTGVCDFGPCVGTSLERFETRVEGDDLWITLPDA